MSFGGRIWGSFARDKTDDTNLTEYECGMLQRNSTFQLHQTIGGVGKSFGLIGYSLNNDIYLPKWGGWRFKDIFRDDIIDVMEELFSDFIDDYDVNYPSTPYTGFVTGYDLNKPMGYVGGNWYYPAIGTLKYGRARSLYINISVPQQQLQIRSDGGLNFSGSPCLPSIYSPYGGVTKSQAATMLNYLLNDIKADRVRIYPSRKSYSNSNESGYLQLYNLQQPSQTQLEAFAIWRNAQTFFGGTGVSWYSTSYLFPSSTRIDTTDDPEPTDPYETEDPNDDNPSSEIPDTGGDGDWTMPNDPFPVPNLPTIDMTGAGVATIYNPSQGQLRSFAAYFWDPTILAVVRQMISSIDEVFIRLHIVPVQPSTEGSHNIIAGWLDSEVAAPVVAYDTVEFNFGTISIKRYFGSYLDFNPYTKFQLYLPYIGMVDINVDDFMPSPHNGDSDSVTMGVEYHISVSSGACTAFVKRNSNVYAQYTGNCATEIPFTASSAAQLWTGLLTAVSTAAIATGASSALTPQSEITRIENEAMAAKLDESTMTADELKSAVKANEARYLRAQNQDIVRTASERQNVLRTVQEVISSKYQVTKMGQIGANAGQIGSRKACLFITRPLIVHPEKYKHFEGYPLNLERTFSSCHGFTKCEKVLLTGLTASQSELREIETLLKQGVYF